MPEEQLPLESLNVQDDLIYTKYPVKILETTERVTRSKMVRMCKVQWSHHPEDEATWDRGDKLMAEFSQLFSSSSESR